MSHERITKMDSGYLGAFVVSTAFIVFTAGYWLLRANSSNRLLTSDGFATVFAMLVTAMLALGVAIFAGNAYLTDIESTIVSALVVLGAAGATAVIVWRVQPASSSAISSNTKNVSKPLSSGPTGQASAFTMPNNRSRKLAA
jgi:hypothetical protein